MSEKKEKLKRVALLAIQDERTRVLGLIREMIAEVNQAADSKVHSNEVEAKVRVQKALLAEAILRQLAGRILNNRIPQWEEPNESGD